jgi:ABC-type amino acid transport system permease subunit
MTRFYIFIIRAVLAAAFAVLLSRFFYPGANVVYVACMGIFLVGAAYIAEYFRNKKST